MLLKFLENNSDIENSCEIIMNSLPVCKVRGISYSTFSMAQCNEDGDVKIIEEALDKTEINKGKNLLKNIFKSDGKYAKYYHDTISSCYDDAGKRNRSFHFLR